MKAAVVDYDILKNEFLNIFLWFRNHLDENNKKGDSISGCKDSIFWLPFFEMIAHLHGSVYYRYKFDDKSAKGNWTDIERRPLDNSEGQHVNKKRQYRIVKTYNGKNFSLRYYRNGNDVHKRLSVLFKTRTQKMGRVEWVFKKRIDDNWYENAYKLFNETLKLYHNHQEAGKAELFKIINLDHANSQLKSTKKVWDPEQFIDDLTRRLFLFLRQSIYSYLNQLKLNNNIDTKYPFSLFILKAHLLEGETLPAFSYYFDRDQLTTLAKNLVSSADIDKLQYPQFLGPGEGLCGFVAKTKAFQYVKDWRKAMKNSTKFITGYPKSNSSLEERFIHGKDLYEWPIVEERQIKYIICLTQQHGKVLMDNKLLTLSQLIYGEWQKISLILQEANRSAEVGHYFKSALARMKGVYNHSFQQRFFGPIQVILNKVGKDDKRFTGLRKRISMYQFAVQAINQNMQDFLLRAPQKPFNLNSFIVKDIRKLFNWNKEYMQLTMDNPGYAKIRLICDLQQPARKINVNKDIFEQAILQIITNALERDVFLVDRVYHNPERYHIKINLRYQCIDNYEYAIIQISNNGEKISPPILHHLNEVFDDLKARGIREINEFDYKPISNRKGSNTGTGLIYSAAVFASVNAGNRSGYVNVSSLGDYTTFSIFLPLNCCQS